jgi:hypothetical protein
VVLGRNDGNGGGYSQIIVVNNVGLNRNNSGFMITVLRIIRTYLESRGNIIDWAR